MPHHVQLQHNFVDVKSTTQIARKFLAFVSLLVLLHFDGRAANLLAFYAQAREDARRLHLVLFQVTIEVPKCHESGAAVLAHHCRVIGTLLWRFFQRSRAVHFVLPELFSRVKAFAALGALKLRQGFLVLGHVLLHGLPVVKQFSAQVENAI